MRIFIVSPLYPPDLGRVAGYVKALATRLKASHDVTVVTYGAIPEEIPGVRISCVSKNWPIVLRMAAFTIRLWREIARADVLLVCDGASVGVPSVIAGWLRRVPMVRLVDEDEVEERRTSLGQQRLDSRMRFIQRLQRWALLHAKRMVFSSSWLQQKFVERYHLPASTMIVSAHPPEREEILSFPMSVNPFQLLVVSSLTSTNGLRQLVDQIPSLVSLFPEIRLVFAKDGVESESLKQQVKDLGIEAHVSFLGVVSHAEKWFLLKTSVALIVPAEEVRGPEEMSLGYAAGIPVIEIKESLVQALTSILKEESLRKKMIEEGSRKYDETVGWEQHVAMIDRLIQTV